MSVINSAPSGAWATLTRILSITVYRHRISLFPTTALTDPRHAPTLVVLFRFTEIMCSSAFLSKWDCCLTPFVFRRHSGALAASLSVWTATSLRMRWFLVVIWSILDRIRPANHHWWPGSYPRLRFCGPPSTDLRIVLFRPSAVTRHHFSVAWNPVNVLLIYFARISCVSSNGQFCSPILEWLRSTRSLLPSEWSGQIHRPVGSIVKIAFFLMPDLLLMLLLCLIELFANCRHVYLPVMP